MYVVVAPDQVQDGALARAGRADEGYALPGFDHEGDVLEHPVLLVAGVGEPDVVELDAALDFRQDDGMLVLRDQRFRVQQGEDLLRGRDGALQGRELLRQLLDRLEEAADVLQEFVQRADGDDARERGAAAETHDDGQGADAQQVESGTEQREDHHLAEARLVQVVVLFGELVELLLLAAEDLDDLHAGQVLAEIGVDRGQPRAHDAVRLARDQAENDGQHQHDRQQYEAVQRQAGVEREHDDDQAGDFDHVAEQLDQDVGEDLVDGLHVVGDAGHQLADRRRVEKAHGQRFDVREDLVAQVVDDVLAHLLHHQELEPVAQEEAQQRQQVLGAGDQHALEARVRHLSGGPFGAPVAQHDLTGLAGDELVDRVADDDRAPDLETSGDQHEREADEEGAEVRLHVAQDAQDGVAFVVDVGRVTLVGRPQQRAQAGLQTFLTAHSASPPFAGVKSSAGCSSRNCFSSCCLS